MDKPVRQEPVDRRVHKGLQVPQVPRVNQEYRVQLVNPEHQDLMDNPVLTANRDPMVPRDP